MSQRVEVLPEGVELLREYSVEEQVAADFLTKRYPGLFMHSASARPMTGPLMDRVQAMCEALRQDFSCGTAVQINCSGRTCYEPGDFNQRMLKSMDDFFFYERSFMPDLTGGEFDTLIALIENGPLEDGDVPSKSGRDGLLDKGFAVKMIKDGQDGYQAASYAGADYYKRYYGKRTLREAIAYRHGMRSLAQESERA